MVPPEVELTSPPGLQQGDQVLVVGGGLAGLACAAALGEAGKGVVLLESRQRLGGRASSFHDSATGEILDNCQHVSLGCCTNFANFCRRLGIDRFFDREDRLIFIGPRGTRHVFRSSPLPAPLHLLPAFARLTYLGWSERLRLSFGLRALARSTAVQLRGVACDRWLAEHGQTASIIENFWRVVLVSALSETLDRIDAWHARKVFVDGFLSNRHGWEVWIPNVPLDRLYGTELQGWLRQHNVALRLNAGVKQIQPATDRAGWVATLRSGERLFARTVVLATPPHLVPDLAPVLVDWWHRPGGPCRLENAPISSVHLWHDRPLCRDRHVTFVGRTSQWLFNRWLIEPDKQLAGPGQLVSGSSSAGCYSQVVISAAYDLQSKSMQETIDLVDRELAEALPMARSARLLRGRVVTEHRAVLSMLPGVDQVRPGPRTPLPGLYLAGDWIDTGWPSTMEGAVRSGRLAAAAVLDPAADPRFLLTPPLPTARLSNWLLGL